jgi:NADP-dependent 3-hydroxy acid dehydrogenase YdfG
MTIGQLKEEIMKTVFITGASSGIGKAAAFLFQKQGWNVAATMRNPDKETGLNGLKNVRCYSIDVTDVDSIQKGITSAINDFGAVDVLVNNAGVYTTKPLEMVSEKDINHLINTNIIGTVNAIKMILPYFRSRSGGKIINISSVAGKSTFPFQSLYHGTKWAIEGISEGLYYELKNLNIQIKVVEPGMVKTNLYDAVKNLAFDDYPAEYHSSFRSWHNYLIESFQKGYGPDVTAKTIYKAALDNKCRLRYASGLDTKLIFFLRTLLPFTMYRRLVQILSRS